jgi:hypothetical protein
MGQRTRLLSLVIAAATVAAISATPATAAGHDQFSALNQSAVAPPNPVKGSDGRYHFVYEVQLVNPTSLPWRVRSIAAHAAGASRPILGRWSGGRVAKVMVGLGDREPTRNIAPGAGALLHLTFSVASQGAIPRAIVQRLVVDNTSRPLVGPPTLTQTGGRVRVARRAPVALGAPLAGDNWLAADGCCTAKRHVRSVQSFDGHLFGAQRFAIDWERVDEQGRLFVGDKAVLTNWFGYGQPIYAVSDGTIVHAVDGEPDQVPGALPVGITAAKADGNGILQSLPGGRYALYGHMIPGTLTVHVGDRVTKGQLLGRVGNSGNSSAPHLHLHVVDRNRLFGANGVPYVFDRFTVTRQVASTKAFDRAEETGEPARMRPVRTGPRVRELPLDQVIVAWP